MSIIYRIGIKSGNDENFVITYKTFYVSYKSKKLSYVSYHKKCHNIFNFLLSSHPSHISFHIPNFHSFCTIFASSSPSCLLVALHSLAFLYLYSSITIRSKSLMSSTSLSYPLQSSPATLYLCLPQHDIA